MGREIESRQGMYRVVALKKDFIVLQRKLILFLLQSPQRTCQINTKIFNELCLRRQMRL
jgi:hypothetical protein